ncbi:restriction endonuclease subunit S [Mycobacterium vicinigordonae]|uniref:Restriction endonuclease subunit S n=1 Tax=Mycobacterium vicinigordonae TaxID=1719132 RepID=A0A7D6E0P4_9MYCO|nr:restriction endonuclease subunit S [Mycobacterium vicinigordonae]QLL09324.1 restriction endonuclease subunit S [Mycobacterium vicinigordonae]
MTGSLGDYLQFSGGEVVPALKTGGSCPVYGANGVIGYTSESNARGPLIVVGRVGSCCGSVHYCHGDAWVSDNAFVCRARRPEETRYWYYLLKSLGLNRFRAGSGQPVLNQRVLRSVPVHAANLADRRRIGDMLASLDDKIVANARVIATAEVLMTTLVEQVSESTTLANLAQRSTASINPRSLSGNVALYSFPAFDHGRRPMKLDAKMIESVKFSITHPCVLFAKLNPRIPRIWNVSCVGSETGLASSEFVVLRPDGVDTSVLWSALRQPDVTTTITRLARGMTGSRQRIQPRELLGIKVRDVRCLDHESSLTIATLGAVCEQGRAESAELAAMRDRLLPQLMSGDSRLPGAPVAGE